MKDKYLTTSNIWSSLFHDQIKRILAPRGFKKHFSGKYIAQLEFLTEERINKCAMQSKGILDNYVGELDSMISGLMESKLARKEETERAIQKIINNRTWLESRYFYGLLFRDYEIEMLRKKLIEHDHNIVLLNQIKWLIVNVRPKDSTSSES